MSVVLQYDFDYNPTKIVGKVSDELIFIGSFKYKIESDG